VSTPVIEVRDLAVHERETPLFSRVSFSVPAGGAYALLGKGSGPRELLRCVLGERRPDAGSVVVLGMEARKARRRLRSRLSEEILLLDDPTAEALAAVSPGRTVLAATGRPEVLEAFEGRVGILGRGRLAAEDSVTTLARRFRRIRYANRLTETRTALGTELDEFDAARVRVRGWGIEAVVSNFTAEAFERFRAIDGVEEASAEPMSLPEIFEAVAGS
jgi:ABC-type multidrug transport system ATPase subunit